MTGPPTSPERTTAGPHAASRSCSPARAPSGPAWRASCSPRPRFRSRSSVATRPFLGPRMDRGGATAGRAGHADLPPRRDRRDPARAVRRRDRPRPLWRSWGVRPEAWSATAWARSGPRTWPAPCPSRSDVGHLHPQRAHAAHERLGSDGRHRTPRRGGGGPDRAVRRSGLHGREQSTLTVISATPTPWPRSSPTASGTTCSPAASGRRRVAQLPDGSARARADRRVGPTTPNAASTTLFLTVDGGERPGTPGTPRQLGKQPAPARSVRSHDRAHARRRRRRAHRGRTSSHAAQRHLPGQRRRPRPSPSAPCAGERRSGRRSWPRSVRCGRRDIPSTGAPSSRRGHTPASPRRPTRGSGSATGRRRPS